MHRTYSVIETTDVSSGSKLLTVITDSTIF